MVDTIEQFRLPLFLTAGVVFGLGAALLVLGIFGVELVPGRRSSGPRTRRLSDARIRKLLWGVGAGILMLVLTRWVVAAVVAALVVGFWDRMLGGSAAEKHAIERAEGLANWIESLRDTIAGAAGLEQAIPSTMINAAPSIRPALVQLVDRLRVRDPLPDALIRFAGDLADPSADVAVAALVLNARLRGPGLREVLGSLAITAREELDVRRRVEGSRRSTRRSMQLVVGVIVLVTVGMAVFNRDYVQPYSSVVGQLVLAGVLVMFGAGVFWMRNLSGVAERPRLIVTRDGGRR